MESNRSAREEDESLVYLAGGGIAAMLLGMAMVGVGYRLAVDVLAT